MNDEDSISKPKIQFNTLLELESIKEQAYQNIKNCIDKMIIDNKNEYNNLAGIPIRPHKGDLLIKTRYYDIFVDKVVDAAESARAYKFY